MIHIATVHHKNSFWIDIQLKYLKKFIKDNFKTYTVIDTEPGINVWDKKYNGIEESLINKFDFVYQNVPGSHQKRLKFLYKKILASEDVKANDLLIFIDSDAFPISNQVIPFVKQKLKIFPLIAVRRDENCGDLMPHPCFCATTIRFWRLLDNEFPSINLWGYGPNLSVTHPTNEIGGVLGSKLKEKFIEWYPILRSNKINYHEVFFGIYGDIIYHHGGGSRAIRCRNDFVKYGGMKNYDNSDRYQKIQAIDENLIQEIQYNDNFFTKFI